MALVVWYHAASNTAVRHLDWEKVPQGYIVSDEPAHAKLADEETRRAIASIDRQIAADPKLSI